MQFSLEILKSKDHQSIAYQIRRMIDRYHVYLLVGVLSIVLFTIGMSGASVALLLLGCIAAYTYRLLIECRQMDFTCDLSDFDLRDVINDLERQ